MEERSYNALKSSLIEIRIAEISYIDRSYKGELLYSLDYENETKYFKVKAL